MKSKVDHQGTILIISGWRGAGKTTLCTGLVHSAREAGWQLNGVLSHAVFHQGEKTGIEMEDVSNGKHRLLAQRSRKVQNETPVKVKTCGWNFIQDTLQWGNQVLLHATPCDLLVVDELGPLEIEHGQGWTSGLDALDSGQFHLALVVIRPELLDSARQRWPQAEILLIESTNEIPSLTSELAHRFFQI